VTQISQKNHFLKTQDDRLSSDHQLDAVKQTPLTAAAAATADKYTVGLFVIVIRCGARLSHGRCSPNTYKQMSP